MNFLEAPEGDIHHYPSALLGANPDVVISEFVNDCYLTDLVVGYNAYDRSRHTELCRRDRRIRFRAGVSDVE